MKKPSLAIPAAFVISLVLALVPFPAVASGKTVTVTFQSLPQISSVKAIHLLNRQRIENGIPGGLALEPRLSRGCRERTAKYKELPGQYPHTEIKGQPGYSALGAEAAASSDLGGVAGEWTEIASPWFRAPLHLSSLFDPASTEAWYGEAPSGFTLLGTACMGTGGEARTFSGPTFFSAPGGGNSSVPPSEVSAEIPFSPAEAAGIPGGTKTGPTVVLYAEEVTALPRSARLTGPGGRVIPTRLVTAKTKAPPTHGFPWGPTVGSNYVVIPRPLKPKTSYHLEVHWSGGERSFTQRTTFSTLSAAAAERRTAWGFSCVRLGTCAAGSLRVTLAGNSVRISGRPVANQRLWIDLRRSRLSCSAHARPCPSQSRHFTADVVRLHHARFDGDVRVQLPRATSYGSAVEVHVQLEKFSFGGYRWNETNATIFRRR